MKQLLATQEVIFPNIFHCIKTALKPIIAINETGVNVKTIFEEYNARVKKGIEEEKERQRSLETKQDQTTSEKITINETNTVEINETDS